MYLLTTCTNSSVLSACFLSNVHSQHATDNTNTKLTKSLVILNDELTSSSKKDGNLFGILIRYAH